MMKKAKEDKQKKKRAEEPADVEAATAVESAPKADESAPAQTDQAAQADQADGEPVEVDPVRALEERVASLEDSLLRAKADYQNLLRRSAQERTDAVRFGNVELMRSLLVVADDFERALTATRSTENGAAIADGIRLVYDNFTKALRDHGLEPIDALHRPFDPTIHQALLQQPTDEHPPGTVVEEVAKGYRLQDRVVRAAKVVVAKAAEDQPLDEQSNEDTPANDGA